MFPGCRDERYPGQSGWELLEHIGPLTRTAANAAFALSVISGPSPLDRHSIPSEAEDWILKDLGAMQGARIAYSSDLGFAVVDPEIGAAFEDAIQQLKSVIGSVECAYPAVGNTEGLLDTLVALETDRVGLKAMSSDRGIELDGWVGSILDRTWSADQFTAALMERKRVTNITACL